MKVKVKALFSIVVTQYGRDIHSSSRLITQPPAGFFLNFSNAIIPLPFIHLLHKHAPLKSKLFCTQSPSLWFSPKEM